MILSLNLLESVRARANFACEYCGITETDAGGELSVDHFQPQCEKGSDELANLVYSCFRCNLHKGNYWPTRPTEVMLWNPRQGPADQHLLPLADGTLHAITPTGEQTLRRLKLNRPALIAMRIRRLQQREETRLLGEIRDLLLSLKQMQAHYEALIARYDNLLDSQQVILDLLIRKRS